MPPGAPTLLAGFADEAAMRHAAQRLRRERLGRIDTHSPAPPGEGGGSILPVVIFLAGMLGAAGMAWLQVTAVQDYPIDVGGRPLVFWPAFVPAVFEAGVLCAVMAGFFGLLVLCRMPALYDPLDESDALRRASRDLWFVVLRADPAHLPQARRVLATCHPVLFDELPA